MKIIRKFILVFTIVALLFYLPQFINGQDCNSKEECERLINEYQQKLTDLRSQKSTLSSQIQLMDTQIYLTELQIQETENKIKETEEEIEKLGGRISNLNTSLDHLTKVLLEKIVEGYKRREIPLFDIFLDSNNASVLMNRLKYAKKTEQNDQHVAFQLQQAKLNFEEQKDLREQKKIELDALTAELDKRIADLDIQKGDKQRLLTQTQSDERTYQNLLALAQAEYAAIQGIVAGGGTETELRQVSRGETIASIISGASCNSTGSHLHFTVLDGGSAQNPFDYLTSTNYISNTSDPWTQNASKANWDWPINPPIEFNQGYGSDTWFIQTYRPYPFHNGLDISSSSFSVKAVADGTLYRGSYAVGVSSFCSTGVLPYTRVTHKDSNIDTLYLHTYTQ